MADPKTNATKLKSLQPQQLRQAFGGTTTTKTTTTPPTTTTTPAPLIHKT